MEQKIKKILRACSKSSFLLQFPGFRRKNDKNSSMNLDSPPHFSCFSTRNRKISQRKQDFEQALKKIVVPLLFVSIVFGSFALINVPQAHADCTKIISTSPGQGVLDCITQVGISAVSALLGAIGYAFYTLSSWVLAAFGLILDFAVQMTVIDMATNIKAIPAVAVGWVVFRDLANMAFIFVLLFSAIATILQIDSYGAKRLLPKLVIVALLLNFSFFFTGIVIDASNIIATGFANNITCNPVPPSGSCTMADAIMEALKIQTVTDPGPQPPLQQHFLIFVFTVLGSGFMLVTAFIFLIISVLLITRFVVLIFVLILSPIAFVSMIIPGASISKKWKDALIGQMLFAPAFFVLMSFVLLVISSPEFKTLVFATSPQSFTAAFTPPPPGQTPPVTAATMRIVLNFVIVTVFEVAALMLAKSMANSGPSAVSKLTGFAQKTAGAAVFGTAAYGMRHTLGRVANSGMAQRTAARIPLVGGFAAAGMDKVAKSSFDVRSSLGNEYGKVRTGGFVAQEKAAQARKERVADILKDTEYKDKRAKVEAEKKLNSALTKEHAKTPAEQRQNIAAREQREKDILAKDGELGDAMRELADALNKKEEAARTGNAGALANAVNLEQRARQKQNTATLAKEALVAGRDEVQVARMGVDEARNKTIPGREHFARVMDTKANRFGGKNNIIGRMYTNTMTQHAGKTARAIRSTERKESGEKAREAKRVLEDQKRPLVNKRSGLEAEIKTLDAVRKYGTGNNIIAEQTRLAGEQQRIKNDFDAAVNRNDYLTSGRLQKDLKKLEDEELQPINEFLARFSPASDLNQELASRQASLQTNEAAIKEIDQKIASVGASQEDIRALFEEFRGTQGGTTPPPTP